MSVRQDNYDPYEQERPRSDNRVFNGSTKLITSLLAIMNILVASAVIGCIIIYGKVQAYDVRFNELDRKFDMIINGQIYIPPRPVTEHGH